LGKKGTMKQMKRYTSTVILVLALFVAREATARIGETPEQCRARYGEPTKVEKDKNMLLFQKGGVLIIVNFYDGKADMISFRKAKQNILGMAEEFSDNEIQNLLKANGGTREWKQREIISMNKEWQTEDGEFLAHLRAMDNIMIIATKAHLAREVAKKKAKEDKNMDGF
jgi:hypothetical protein